MFMLKNRIDPKLSEANFSARLSHSKQFAQKHSVKDVSIILFTHEKIFTVTAS